MKPSSAASGSLPDKELEMPRLKVSQAARQGTFAHIAALFPRSYDGSRARFRQNLDRIQQFWPNARLVAHRISSEEGLTIDWIEADALESCERLLIFTCGEHGIEAYVGSAVLQVFINEYLQRLPAETTGLLLVHAINPWGMKYRRRVNSRNVDLNRNFIWVDPDRSADENPYDANANPKYTQISELLNPAKVLHSRIASDMTSAYQLLRSTITLGRRQARDSALLGQYFSPRGLYYGGSNLQEETRVLMNLYRQHLAEYWQVLHLDMHTGYGPRYQMSLVNSALEERDSPWFSRQFDYPLVVKATSEEFYPIQGDMIDCIYRMVIEEFPDKGIYATSFEFGTFGASLLATLRSMRAMILENQLYWYGSSNPGLRDWIKREFEELYLPGEEKWRAKAVLDARQAFDGILRAEGFLRT
jgi:hypothetical protein